MQKGFQQRRTEFPYKADPLPKNIIQNTLISGCHPQTFHLGRIEFSVYRWCTVQRVKAQKWSP